MRSAAQPAVTPEGVRDGDPAVLDGLVARRGGSVMAFCERLCAPDDAALAAAEAFARFRAAVAAADDPLAVDPDTLLLTATRHAAAAFARTGAGDGLRGRLFRDPGRSELCAQIPELLAARADDMLGPEDLAELRRHLDAHPRCHNIATAFQGAEAAYRTSPTRTLPDAQRELILAALAGAAPVAAEPDSQAAEPEPEPHEAEPAPEPTPEPHAAEPEPEPTPEPHAAAPEREPTPEPHAAEPEREPTPGSAEAGPVERAERALPRTRRHIHLPSVHTATHGSLTDHGPVYRFVLPAAAVLVAVIIILAIAGVFGGEGPAPAVATPAVLDAARSWR